MSSLRPITLPTSRIARARAVVDHGGAQAGAVAAVFLVDVLDHLFAPFMLEIDVDVGRLLALLGDEAFEQEVGVGRIDRGDRQAIADRAVGGRAAALAEDRRLARPGEGDDRVDGEEVAGEVELLDQLEFVAKLGGDLVGDAAGIAFLRPVPGQHFEMGLGARSSGTLSRGYSYLSSSRLKSSASAKSRVAGARGASVRTGGPFPRGP